MTTGPVVSVVMPCRDCEAFLAASIESVLKQTFQGWELIIVDDASNDASTEIAESHAQKDHRVRFIRHDERCGAAAARNTATEHARGRYIAFLDSDDLWRPQKLERQTAFMEQTGAVMSHTSYAVITEEGTPTGTIIQAKKTVTYGTLLRYNAIGCLTAMYDTSKIGRYYGPDIKKRNDYALWLRITRQGHASFGLDECLADYRKRRNNSVSSNKLDLLKYQWELFRDVEALGIPQAAFSTLTSSLAGILRRTNGRGTR